jgi:hypothetical protein
VKLKSIILLTFLSLSIANLSNAQIGKDSSIQLSIDSMKIDDLTKGFQGQLSSSTDASKKVQKSLLAKITNFFKFSTNFKESEKKRILEIVNSLGIEDSIKLSESKIKLLILQLSKRENQHYDTLIKLISELKIVPPPIPTSVLTKEEIITEEESANKGVKDKDVDDLTSKILSIVTKKATESEEDKKKNEKLAEIRKINAKRDDVYKIIDSARGVVRKFVVHTINKVKVLGFYNYNQSIDNANLNLNNYNNIIYNGLFVDNKTGHIKDLNGWDTAAILDVLDKKNKGLDKLENKKIKPIANIIFSKKFDFANFATSNSKQKTLIEDLSYLLPLRESTEGVCLQIDQPDLFYKSQITEFILRFSQEIKKVNKNYKIYLIIPSANINPIFEFSLINQSIDYYILDFYSVPEKPSASPIAPIKGKDLSSIESTFSFYTNIGIPSSKLILGLSYQGLKWSFNNKTQEYKFIQPLTYFEIRSRYDWPIIYNQELGTATMDSVDSKGDLKRRIYLEDENTLSKKYDYVLQNGIAGVSIYASNFDHGYGDLNDMLTYKLSAVDTLFIEDSVISIVKAPGFFERIRMRWTLYSYVLNHPCMVCFDNIENPEDRARIFKCISGLHWDKDAEKEGISRFQYATRHLFYMSIQVLGIFFVISLILSFLYYKRIKNQGNDISLGSGKSLYVFNLCSWFIVLLSLILVMFSSNKSPYFGVYNIEQNVSVTDSSSTLPVPVGSHEEFPAKNIDSTNTTSGDKEIAREPSTQSNNQKDKSDQNATKQQMQTNAERMAANDATGEVKNKYLNSTLRIGQNAFFRNQSKRQNAQNNSAPATEASKTKKESDIVTSSSMSRQEFTDYKNDSYCITELETNKSGCVDVPFKTLIFLIILSICIGIFFDVLFIRKLTQKNEIP